jgi:hypothetical protein
MYPKPFSLSLKHENVCYGVNKMFSTYLIQQLRVLYETVLKNPFVSLTNLEHLN